MRKTARGVGLNHVTAFDIINTIFMCMVCITVIFPIWDTVVISVSKESDISMLQLNLWPKHVIFDAYKYIFESTSFLHGLFISVSRTICGTIYRLLIVCMAAYALTRQNMPFRKAITIFFVLTMFFSGGLIPTYLNMRNLNLLNNFLVYVLPSGFSMFEVVIVRNFFLAIDPALEEAATIDGASAMQVMWLVIVPLSKPVIATIALWHMVYQWNAWFDNMIYCTSANLKTLQLMLRNCIVDPEKTQLNIQMFTVSETTGAATITTETIKSAIVILVILPIICVYPFLQKYFVKGIMLGAVKG